MEGFIVPKILDIQGFNQNKLIIQNKLTSKPQKVINKLEKLISSQDNFAMQVQQDYSKGNVILSLYNPVVYVSSHGHPVYNVKNIPATSAEKTYLKTAKQMLNETNDAIKLSGKDFANHPLIKHFKNTFIK